MIFGKHINRYYLKYALWLLVGLTALWLVDYFQLIIPEMYRMVINGMNEGQVEVNGTMMPFDIDFLLDRQRHHGKGVPAAHAAGGPREKDGRGRRP